MFTLMTESDWEALRLTDDDLDRLLLRPCDLARYIDAQRRRSRIACSG